MLAVRIPLALGFGLLFTLAVFTVLFRFVDGPVSPPDLRKVVDVFSMPLRPTPPPPPPARPTRIDPPTLIPQPGHGRIQIVEPPRNVPPPRIEQPGRLQIETGRGGLPSGGIDREPIPVLRIAPDYPPRALASGIEGWVQVRFSITAAGTVKDASVVAADPRGIFDDAALKAIARWRYNPRVEGGVAVERIGVQTVIRFQLER